jgi:hypothetical protein
MPRPLILLALLPFAAALAQAPDPNVPPPLPPPAPDAAQPAGAYEEPPVLNAAEILKPGVLTGPNHRVRGEVHTYSGENWYVIDSDVGMFEVSGNVMLQHRIAEIYAILKLREISKSKTYGDALKAAAKSPFVMAKNLIEKPVDTITAVPKGVFKFVKRTGRKIQDAAEGREKSNYEDNEAAALLGVSKAKRELAYTYGVNPYSSNSALQKELNSVGWTSFAGKATVTVLTAGIGGGIASTFEVSGVLGRNAVRIRDTDPQDLRIQNKQSLLNMGASDAVAEQILSNPAFSPLHITNLVTSLEDLKGIGGRIAFAQFATGSAENETDAIFFEQTAALIARVHAESAKLKAIEIRDGLPVCIGATGTFIVALHWDYAAWTERAAAFHDMIAAEANGAPIAVMITGQMSPRLKQELQTRKVQAFDRVLPGPLK